MLEQIANYIVSIVSAWGYFGIFVMMFIESSFFVPFPSEIVMIPAGFLVYKGEMSFSIALICGVLGSLIGALCNYYVALFFGRNLLLKYGKFVKFSPEKLEKLENFFKKHGEISTFNGRLIPGIRQYISLPAGLAKMNLAKFSFYTSLGSGIWVFVLVALGYFIGENQALIKEKLHIITIITLICVVLISAIYIKFRKK